MDNYVQKEKRISLTACKKILNTNGVVYTNEEVIELRDWLYHMAEITFDVLDREERQKQMTRANQVST